MEKRYYLAYGSNLNTEQMRYRCPAARVVGTAEIKGYELLFKGSKSGSYLTIEPNPAETVPVAVWAVTEADERSLDRYEGYPHFYYKKELRLPVKGIKTGKVRNFNAFVYIMREDRPFGIPSKSYLAVCGEGYETFDFDIMKLLKAYMKSYKEATDERK